MPIITEIDDKYIDIDFTKDPKYVFGDHGLPLYGNYGESYEEKYGELSDAEIEAEIEKTEAEGLGQENLVTRIFDQEREGACVSDAYGQAHETTQAIQFGTENVIHVSAISLYKLIGSSPNSGANVGDGWNKLSTQGIGPLDNAANRQRFGNLVMPNTGFYTKYPDGYRDLMKQFAGFEASIIRSTQGLKSAGVTPGPIVVGREGHSICYLRVRKSNGRWVFLYVNSWGQWGQKAGNMPYGFGHDTLSQIQKSASYAVKIRAVKAPQLITPQLVTTL